MVSDEKYLDVRNRDNKNWKMMESKRKRVYE
jgi:hypothetical protein